MKVKDIFRKENIVPLIVLGLAIFGAVMIIIAADWVNIVWPVIVIALIIKGLFKTDKYFKLLEAYDKLVNDANNLKAERDELVKMKSEYELAKPVVENYAAHNSALQKQVYELQDRLREASGTAIKKADEITKDNLKTINDIKAAVNIVQEKQGMKPKRTRRTKKS